MMSFYDYEDMMLKWERDLLRNESRFWVKRYEQMKAENARLKAELAEERSRFDKLSDFEVAEAKDFQEAKLYLRILMEYLQENGYDVEKLEKIIALKRCIMKLEETNE